jgi:phosphoglycerol transferase MdoB-like AlkP superfamily enzyme
MLLRFRLPKTILWVYNLLIIYLVMFTAFRLITLVAFIPEDESWVNTLPSFWLGFRYDLRWISLILLPIVLVSLRPEFSPFYSRVNKRFWTWYLAFATFFVFFFFAADFGCFSYNRTRLNASALNFVEDAQISAQMLWQSYPVVWMLLGLVIAVLLLRVMFRKLYGNVVIKTDGLGIPYRRKWFITATFLLGLFIYGNVGFQPLRWRHAFGMNDNFSCYLALNPLQNFFTTLKFRTPVLNADKAKESFPVIADWLGIGQEDFSFKRTVVQPNTSTTKPNVVLVVCESFSMYKSSMSGNELNTTPYFQSLADSGMFFEKCFTPHFSTARGLFATTTGIPDVQLSKFSTRNPLALNQHTIINNFEGYNKFYFLGGSPSFNNFEGLIKNIDGVEMVTEGKFTSKPINVWGISDKDLFLEANKRFAQQDKPFFAIVQTADNHRPFMIPEDEKEFKQVKYTKEQLLENGFESNEELNAFRYADYCIEKFMQAARKEEYFDNTIFVFIGDHGVSGNAKAVYPEVWTKERLTEEHVPLLFYAPKWIASQKRSEVVSQIDVLPTIAGLAGQSYTNTTLGRDLNNKPNANHGAFIIHHDEGRIGMVTNEFYFTKNINFHNEKVHFFPSTKKYSQAEIDSVKKKMSELTTAYYETAKWMLMNNQKP